MSSLNKVEIIGRLGSDPEIRVMPNGESVANLSVATSESWIDKVSGEKREQTEWHRIVLFSKRAEVARQYLHKGSLIYIEGKLKTRKWQDQQGIERYTTEIHGDNLIMLSHNTQQGSAHWENNVEL